MMIRTADGAFRPATQHDADELAGLPIGRLIGCTMKQLRNGQFHRKLFALLAYLYDVLPAKRAIYEGTEITQSRKRHRDEMVILAGHYTVDVTGRGDIRMVAQSLSYSKCSQRLAETIYSDLIDKALALLGGDQTRDGLDDIINQLVGFDS